MKRLSVVIFLIFGVAQRAQAGDLPGYDFHYSVSGDSSISPAQVFDDGHHLYLQFRDQTLVPALFIRTVNGVTRLPVHPEFPYLVADRLAPEIMLKLDNQQAIVRYTGGRALSNGSRADGSASVLASNRSASVPAGLSFNHVSHPDGGMFHGELIFRRNGEPNGLAPAVTSPYVPSAQTVDQTQGVMQKTADSTQTWNDPRGRERGHETGKSGVDTGQIAIGTAFDAARKERSLKIALHLSPVGGANGKRYIVRAGDSLWRIAHREKVSMAALAACNHLQRLDWLQVGQVLQVPENSHGQAKIGWQTVSWRKKGDSRWGAGAN